MIACYDLARCPPTYDVVAFLALAEIERLRRGADHIDIHILPGPASGFRRDSLWPRSVEERVALRDNVLVPLCRLLPSVLNASVDANRNVEGWGKGEYHISLPAIMKALKADCRPLRLTTPPVRYPFDVTFTLREADHHQLRNSQTAEWVEAARVLGSRGFKVAVVRDTLRALEPLPGVTVVPDAARSIEHRAALYAQTRLNVGICNGPMWMSIFMDAPTLMLRPTTNAAAGCYNDGFYAKFGLTRGSQLPTNPPHQRLMWGDDTSENIVQSVEEMLGVPHARTG